MPSYNSEAYMEKCINSLRVSLNCDIYITGSNAKLLSGELATYLGGRYVEFIIYPFSYAEFMELYKTITPDESNQICFQKYILSGGMPYLANIRYAEEPSKQYLHDLFNSVQLKDIVKRNKIWYNNYYKRNTREICHEIKNRNEECYKIMADFFLEQEITAGSCRHDCCGSDDNFLVSAEKTHIP